MKLTYRNLFIAVFSAAFATPSQAQSLNRTLESTSAGSSGSSSYACSNSSPCDSVVFNSMNFQDFNQLLNNTQAGSDNRRTVCLMGGADIVQSAIDDFAITVPNNNFCIKGEAGLGSRIEGTQANLQGFSDPLVDVDQKGSFAMLNLALTSPNHRQIFKISKSTDLSLEFVSMSRLRQDDSFDYAMIVHRTPTKKMNVVQIVSPGGGGLKFTNSDNGLMEAKQVSELTIYSERVSMYLTDYDIHNLKHSNFVSEDRQGIVLDQHDIGSKIWNAGDIDVFVKEDYAIDLHSSGEIGLAENVRLHLLTNSPEAAILMRPNSRINKIEQMEIHTNSASLSGPYGIQFETFSSQLGSIGDIFGLTYFGGSFAQQVGEICPLLFDTNGMNVDLFVQGSIEDIGCVLK